MTAHLSATNRRLLKTIGLRIQNDLFQQKRSVEDLSLESGVARSTLREIIAGRSNPRVLTLDAIIRSLGYGELHEFLKLVAESSG